MKLTLVLTFAASAAGALLRSSNSWSEHAVLKAQAESLERKIQRYADRLEPGPTREFLKTLRLCAPCSNYRRFGENNDGGYVMCADGLDQGLVGAYSYGINGFDGWGMAIAKKYNIPLNEYDCTNSKKPTVCEGCDVHFHSQCILDQDGDAEEAAAAIRGDGNKLPDSLDDSKPMVTAKSFKTLTQMFQESGQANAKERSLLLKIDVESAEWKVFAEEPLENLKKFREIVVEYHWINKVDQHMLYEEAVKRIEDAGFSVTHMHGNNYGGPMQHFGEYSIPDVIEVTYVQTPKEGCAKDIPYKSRLDMPNNKDASWSEMPDAVLPKDF